ncbi:hypothetical protein MMC19_006221 [Ptychographa xylographoides]|nr:hypothetical protein [Ptychographa xylographoides]
MAQKEFLAEIVPKTPIVAHVYKIFHEQFPDSRICSQRIKAERTRILKHHVWDQDKDDGAVKENETKQEKAVRKFQRQQEAKRRRLAMKKEVDAAAKAEADFVDLDEMLKADLGLDDAGMLARAEAFKAQNAEELARLEAAEDSDIEMEDLDVEMEDPDVEDLT